MTWYSEEQLEGLYIPIEDPEDLDPLKYRDPAYEMAEQEELPRYIDGQKVSDIEARLYFAAAQHPDIQQIEMQVSYVAGKFLPGEIRLDFLFHTNAGIKYPVFTDGNYWHRSPERVATDAYQEDKIDQILQGAFCMPVQRVPGTDLENQEEALIAMENILSNYYTMR